MVKKKPIKKPRAKARSKPAPPQPAAPPPVPAPAPKRDLRVEWETAPHVAKPGGVDLMRALREISTRYVQAANAPGADPILPAAARVLRALALAMQMNNLETLTKKPKTKQSPHAWAKSYLRSPSTDTQERADAWAAELEALGINPATHNWDGIRERFEAVDRFLARARKIRNGAANPRSPLTLNEQRCAALIPLAAECFPRLFTTALNGTEWIALAKRIAAKVDWDTLDDERIMRAALVICGMSKDEARALTHYLDS